MSSIYQYGDQQGAVATVERIAIFVDQRLAGLVQENDTLSGEYQAAIAGIAAEADETDPAMAILAGYLQSAIRQPALAAGELDDRLEAFQNLADDCIGLLANVEVTGYGRYQAKAVQLALCAILTSMTRIITTSIPNSRSHAISIGDDLLTEFEDMVDALDQVAESFEDQDWEARYFSQTQSYTVAAKLVTAAVRYLLISAYDLKVEKKFILSEPTAPVVLAIQEYSDMEIGAALDLLIAANSLTGDEILLLPPLREITVYL